MVQKGNPHQLPIRQHSFPAKSISRFCKDSGGVEVVFKEKELTKQLRPTDPPFVVKQSWDAKAEAHFKEIEDPFQAMVDQIELHNTNSTNIINHGIVSRMYASWYARAHFQKFEDQQLLGVIGPAKSYSEDEREQLEKAGVVSIDGENKIAGRQMAWPHLLRHMDLIERDLSNREWGLLNSSVGEFIVPDKPPADLIALPLTPTRMLVLDYPSQTIPLIAVAQINQSFLESAETYYFAREINKCAFGTK